MESDQVFISYSRKDGTFVKAITDLMRLTGAEVFRDQDSIPFGKRWRPAITEAISDAKAIIVFWSVNASTSKEVKNEYRQALEQQKDIVPVLLDSSPIPVELLEYKGINFRPIFAKNDDKSDQSLDTENYNDWLGNSKDKWEVDKGASSLRSEGRLLFFKLSKATDMLLSYLEKLRNGY